VFKDLTPVATAGVLDGLLMLVNPSSPAHTVKEFIDYAKKNRVLHGSPGIGNGLHLATALFNQATGLSMEHVPFKGASEVSAALLGGNIDVMFVTPPSVLGLIRAGSRRCGAEIRLPARQPLAGADGGILPRAGRRSAKSSAGCGYRTELEHDPEKWKPVFG